MDQLVLDVEFSILYFDLVQLIKLMEDSGNEDIQAYVDSLQKIVDEQK